MNVSLLTIVFTLACCTAICQQKNPGMDKAATQPSQSKGEVKWYSIEEAMELTKKQPKKIFVKLYTSWCGWCKVMDTKTFSNAEIAQFLNTNYYPVKFNAESMDTVHFRDTIFINRAAADTTIKRKRSTHDFTIYLLRDVIKQRGRIGYPSISFLDEKGNQIFGSSGFLAPKDLQPLLHYTVNNVFYSTPYQEFRKYWDSTFHAKTPFIKHNVKWYTLNGAVNAAKKEPKKIYVDISHDWCFLCKMLYQTTYNDSTVAQYLNEHFYPVRLDAFSRDTIRYNGNTFTNNGSQPGYHQLAVSFLQGKMYVPAAVYIGPNSEMITAVPGYKTPDEILPILEFFGEDHYQTTQWQEFIKAYNKNK